MAGIVVHLSTDELEARFRAADTVVERTHFQVIWLLSKGRTVGERAEVTAISERWVSKLALWAAARQPRRPAAFV